MGSHPFTDSDSSLLDNATGIPIAAATHVSVIGNLSLESRGVGNEGKDEIFDDVQAREASDSSTEVPDSNDFGGGPDTFEDDNSTDLPDVNLKNSSGFSGEVLAAVAERIGRGSSELDARGMERGKLEADTTMSNRSFFSSFGQGEASHVENHGTKDKTTCDVSDGRWVFDESYPLYATNSCPFVDEGFSCEQNGRLDKDYMQWRWQPYGCSIPRYNSSLV